MWNSSHVFFFVLSAIMKRSSGHAVLNQFLDDFFVYAHKYTRTIRLSATEFVWHSTSNSEHERSVRRREQKANRGWSKPERERRDEKGKRERSQIHLSGVGPSLVGLSLPKISGPGPFSHVQLSFRYSSFSFNFLENFITQQRLRFSTLLYRSIKIPHLIIVKCITSTAAREF